MCVQVVLPYRIQLLLVLGHRLQVMTLLSLRILINLKLKQEYYVHTRRIIADRIALVW